MIDIKKVDTLKLNSIILNILLIIVAVIFGLLMYWSFRPYDVIDYKVDHFEMQKEEYVVGEPLTYRLAFCKKGNYEAQVVRKVKDTVVYSYPLITSSFEEGCHDFISSTNITPNVPQGTYIFENDIIFKVNPVREIRYHLESTPFKIINPN